ncbi:MAG TPA: DUF6515 family protein [Steroidobacteraceae bacterium]|nr:DUF6515 family protein [Steroidobacteraceae bacterium]
MRKRAFWSSLVIAGAMIAANGAAIAQHGGAAGGAHAGGGGHTSAGASGGGAHQHFDGRFGHNQYYYDHGYSVRTPPAGGLGEVRAPDGGRYWRHGGNWYRWDGRHWIVWAAPFGLFVPFLPWYYTTVWWDGVPYYYANDTYYVWDDAQQQYEVVEPPPGAESGGATQPPTLPPPSDQLFVYPSSGQSAEQQARDGAECQRWATGQTGFDPTVAGGGVPPDQAVAKRNDYFRADVSCLEGRGYTVR